MGYRLSRIMTRTGDDGSTGLGDGTRTGKEALRIEALGELDELNACLGVLRAEPLPDSVHTLLTAIQHDLFDLGGELSIPGQRLVGENRTAWLESHLDAMNATLPPLKEFILPGGSRPAALCHQARTVCRRAERSLVRLSRGEDVAPAALKYLNRLSDLLFVLARFLNKAADQPDILWQRNR
ncbi:MAG: cob(I)yrinic acid a,c-diamide adenosyltransferase [Methylophilaceae bacterium]|nr:cob(I)yrinic acid a,c-diamide adenosyltransferase [Methylophilaceae bacterium]